MPLTGFNLVLIDSATVGDTAAVQNAIIAGADINIANDNRDTALHFAAIRGHHDTVMFLLANGANIEAKNWIDQTPLHLAAQSGIVETGRLLINHGANIEATTDAHDGETPMHYAAFYAKSDFVKLLLENGANYKALSKHGKTPSQRASDNGHHNMAIFIPNLYRQIKSKKMKNLETKIDELLRQVEVRLQ